LSARPAVAVVVCALLLPCLPLASTPVEGGRAVLRVFTDGSNRTAIVFDAAGSNSTATVTLPKAADVTRATVDITGEPYLENHSIAADTRSEFSAFTLSNLDINTTPGEVVLEREFFATDEFGNASLDSRWSWLNSPSSWDLGVTRPGWLHMVSPRGTNFNWTLDNGALVYQTLSGNFTLETKVNCTPQWDWQKSGIMVRQDKDNWVALKYQNQTGKRVQWSVKHNGNMWGDISSGGLSATEVWLRLVREGSRWIAQYSTNGAAWTKVVDTSDAGFNGKNLADPVKAGLLIADGGTWAYWPADYDYFNFTRYLSSGFMLSGALSTPRAVTQARMTWSGLTALNTANTVLSVRTSASSPWERLMPNQTTKLINPGQSPQVLVQITSSGIPTPVLYEFQANFSSLLYPSGLSLALGTGAPFWSRAGELNDTETADFREALRGYLASASPDGNGNVTVPLALASASRGAPVLRNLTIEYNLGAPPAAPSLDAPAQGAFVATQNPELWLCATDPDGDPLWYQVEVSGDGFVTRTVYNQTASGQGWSRLLSPYSSGERALLTAVVPLAQGRTYAWQARAFDGAYWGPFSGRSEFTVDITPPEGSVGLPGRYTGDNSSAGAALAFTDRESGVVMYEYMVGTRHGMDNIVATASTTNATVAVRGMALVQGVNYYFSARARNGAGSWSGWIGSEPFQYWPAGVAPAGISMTSPEPGREVGGIIQIAGTAWLRDGWTRNNTVQYRLDDEPWKFITPRGLNQTRDWSVERDTRALRDGEHRVQARLVDGLINSTEMALAGAVVTVRNSPGPPPLEATFSPAVETTLAMDENGRLEFGVSTSSQNPAIQWYVDGEPRQGETFARFDFRPNHSMAGRHNVSVTVSAGNQSLSRTWNVTVANVNRPPVAGILNPPPMTRWQTGENLSFNASTSADPDPDDRLRYLWDLGDGTQMEGLEVVHAYLAAGTYRITLTVSDGSLQSQASVNLTVTSPTKVIQAGRPGEYPVLPLVLLVALTAAAVGGAAVYLRRRGAGGAAGRPKPNVMYRLPAPSLVDEDEELPRVRETSSTDWKRLEREAAQRPPSLSLSPPPYVPRSSRAAPGAASPPQAHATFTPPARPEGPPQARPGPQYARTARPGPAAQTRPHPSVPPPEDASFEDIPEVEGVPEESIPEAPAEIIPGPPARQGAWQPATPPAARPARKPADPMEELLALLEKNR